MKRSSIQLNSDPADGGGTPPKAAETAAAGKSEREIQLERQNTALKLAVKKTADSKRKAEEAAAHVSRDYQKLKEVQLEAIKPTPAKATSWGFFNS